MKNARILSLIALISPLSGVAASSCGSNAGSTNVECRPLTANARARSVDWSGSIFTIVMENHSYGAIIGSSDAPYINALASNHAIAAGYHDSYVRPVLSLEPRESDFVAAPIGRYHRARCVLFWCASPTLFGAFAWGNPELEDAKDFTRLLDATLSPDLAHL